MQELVLIRQALLDPERQAAIRRAYIGGVAEPAGAAPAPAAAPAAFSPKPLPEDILPGSHEAEMWDMAQEHERQLSEIRASVSAQNQQSADDRRRSAAGRYSERMLFDG